MKRSIAALVMTTSLVFAGGALAQTLDKVVKVGSLGDQSGLYADIGGPGSTVAAQMAIEDSGLLAKGWKIELIVGRSPEQARRRRQHRQAVDRRREGRRVRRSRKLRRRARDRQPREREERRQPQLRLGVIRSHRRAMLAEHRSTGSTTPTCSPTAPARRW